MAPTTHEALPAGRFIPGQILAGRYRVIELVGQGGMGEVYRAEDLKLGQHVALKFLPQALSEDPERLQALFAEVRLARQISHPNVCRVHDIEEMEGTQSLSMEFVDGEDFASLLRRIGRLPADKALEIVQELCDGLAAIHERGVLHRDLKPANVMIDGKGHARITDFGLAEIQGRDADPDSITGTPAYMAPELFAGTAPSVRSDVYSLGLVMYELFTGKPAFPGATLRELVRARTDAAPTPPSQHRPDLDPRIEKVILRCLEREPGRRPKSAREVAALLPGGDPLAAAIAAGRTPSPEMIAAAVKGAEGLRLAVAWTLLVAVVFGLGAATVTSQRARLVTRLALPEPPDAMAARAREVLRALGFTRPGLDRAAGFEFDESAVDRIVARDRSPDRWERLGGKRPPVVTFWYRESPGELVGSPPDFRIRYSDPPWRAGMVGVRLDGRGRLLRLDAPALSSLPRGVATPDLDVLFRAAGLDRSRLAAMPSSTVPEVPGDQHLRFVGDDILTSRPVSVDVVGYQGRPVSFVVEALEDSNARAASTIDLSVETTNAITRWVRPTLYLLALLLGGWLARRNVRAGRSDTRRAVRVGIGMMALRLIGWLLGAHHTAGSAVEQITTSIAWGVYDFAYGCVFYLAVEPYVRRLWPRMLTAWARLVDGQVRDARVGRDLLIGCLFGTLIALAVAAHQIAPTWFGAPPGRPDNVGYVAHQLTSLLGLRQQLGEIAMLMRSNIITIMGFMVILVMARLVVRGAVPALIATFLIFVPLGLPRGEMVALNILLAVVTTATLLTMLMRFGLLAAATAMMTHTLLQSVPLGMGLDSWPASRTYLIWALVLGVAGYGFFRSLGGRPAIKDNISFE